MIRVILILFTFVAISLNSNDVVAQTIGMHYSSTEGSDDETVQNPSHGKRTPPAPIYCEIDFSSGTITGSSYLNDVVQYELWNEDETICLVVSESVNDFLELIQKQPTGLYCIRFLGDTFILTGYIDI